MRSNLLRSCAAVWAAGLLGMFFARAVLALEPRALGFQLPAGLWLLGGLGYVGLALHVLTSRSPRAARRAALPPADLSALLRRR